MTFVPITPLSVRSIDQVLPRLLTPPEHDSQLP